MEFSSFFFHLLFFSLIFQLSNTIVSSTKVQIPAQDAPIDKLHSLTEQMDENNADIGKRLVQQRIKRDTDVVYIDHRQSNCLAEPRSQGRGRDFSYAFATIAFYEWLYCKKTGEFKAFSEQYVIDCGSRSVNVIEFIGDCGLVLRANYPYTGIQGDCPYHASCFYQIMGNFHIHQRLKMYIPLDQLEQHLQYGPIILFVKINHDLLSYVGGVDENEGHTPKFHKMLLIGYGRENGQDYWLLRNSYFDPSISDGNYKLNKNVEDVMGFGIGLGGPISG